MKRQATGTKTFKRNNLPETGMQYLRHNASLVIGSSVFFLLLLFCALKKEKRKEGWPHQVLILGPSTRRVDVMPLHHVAFFTFLFLLVCYCFCVC